MKDIITINKIIETYNDGNNIVEFEYSYGIPLHAVTCSENIPINKEITCEIDFIVKDIFHIYKNINEFNKNNNTCFGLESIYADERSYIIRMELKQLIDIDNNYYQYQSKIDSYYPIIVIPKKLGIIPKTGNILYASAWANIQILEK